MSKNRAGKSQNRPYFPVNWLCYELFNNRYIYWKKREPKNNILSFCRGDNKYIDIVNGKNGHQ